MDPKEVLAAIMAGDLMAASRADANVTRQGVMNHQNTAHFTDLSFVRDAFEISYPEAAAMSKLVSSELPTQVAGLNTGYGTPSSVRSDGKAA